MQRQVTECERGLTSEAATDEPSGIVGDPVAHHPAITDTNPEVADVEKEDADKRNVGDEDAVILKPGQWVPLLHVRVEAAWLLLRLCVAEEHRIPQPRLALERYSPNGICEGEP